ncbi:MAG: GGDEF domain-containing protein [Oscillospiraceae bacterium]
MRKPFSWLTSRLNRWDDICTDENARLRTNNIFATMLVSFISLFMLVLNLLQGNGFMAGALAVMVLLYGSLFIMQLFNPGYRRWAAWVFGLTALAMCIFLLYWGGPNGYSFLWVFIVPNITVMSVPLKDSLVFNAIWLGSITVLLNSPLRHLLQYHYSDDFRILLPVALLFVIGCTYLAEMVRTRTQNRLQETARQLRAFAFVDPLTGAYNRHALTSHFGDANVAPGKGLSFSVIDLDHFKDVNDTYGHLVGDALLQHVVACINRVIPSNAHLYRWGGEEFLLVLKTDDLQEAAQVWEAIRKLVEASPMECTAGHVSMTLSIGGLCTTQDDSIHQCIKTADERLYHAKRSGRNRVVYADA